MPANRSVPTASFGSTDIGRSGIRRRSRRYLVSRIDAIIVAAQPLQFAGQVEHLFLQELTGGALVADRLLQRSHAICDRLVDVERVRAGVGARISIIPVGGKIESGGAECDARAQCCSDEDSLHDDFDSSARAEFRRSGNVKTAWPTCVDLP